MTKRVRVQCRKFVPVVYPCQTLVVGKNVTLDFKQLRKIHLWVHVLRFMFSWRSELKILRYCNPSEPMGYLSLTVTPEMWDEGKTLHTSMKSKIQAQPYPNPAITFSLKSFLFFQGDMCDTCTKSIILPKNNIVEKQSQQTRSAFPKREASNSLSVTAPQSRTCYYIDFMPHLHPCIWSNIKQQH